MLALLAARPTHGYGLVAELSRDAGAGPLVSRAQVYYSLKKLVGLSLIVPVGDRAPSAGPERETYQLSTAGRRAMSRAIAGSDWAQERPAIPFHMWLAMLGQADPPDRAAAIRARRAHLTRRINEVARTLNTLRDSTEIQDALKLAVATHDLEVLRLEDRLLAEVEPMLGRNPRK